ncbi:hypothetical protein MPSI1_002281 [Malassezia psittaci]|uniref:L-ornithine N(5)-monooxygenase [NAD(P)H] n=1 Tax=Malassezia psittaci TaxID=1821823 RepID=A0AAF0JEE6_9BASI|nr:hypothetical protein MPSI1_002281 [Malassezia psittaci]
MSKVTLPWNTAETLREVPVPENGKLLPDAKERLQALAKRIKEDISTSSHHADWIPRQPEGDQAPIQDVVIIGAGQAGMGVAFALKRERIDRVLVVDAGDDPSRVGPWNRYARMHTLRSPKRMKGIELDVPSLHIKRWFEACYGEKAWDETELVPRLDWNDYLVFYRWVTEIDVRHRTKVVAVHRPKSDSGPFALELVESGNSNSPVKTIYARRVVFSLGLIGGGGIYVPEMIQKLPRSRWMHTEEEFDLATVKGKRVAVLGGGASGFDNAGTVLEAGASKAMVFMRRNTVPNTNSLRWMEFPGMQEHFYDLSDEQKLEFTLYNGGLPQPPTQQTIWRCFEKPNFELRKAEQFTDVEDKGDELLIHSVNDKGETFEHPVDLIIAATGYKVDLSLRPELSEFVSDIKTWAEAYPPSANTSTGSNPYLGTGFEFTPKASTTPWISRLHHFSTGARSSMGVTGNQLSGIYGGMKRMAWSMATSITRENWPTLMNDFRRFQFIEVTNVGKHEPGNRPYASGPRYAGERTIP